MTAPITTKAQAQAYRFGVRRLENAVATGDSFRRSLGGPRHGLSFVIGFVLAALVLAGFAVYGFISPEPSIGEAKVVVDSDDGGAYVVRDGRLYPALNLASALLAAGRDTSGKGGSAGTGKPKTTAVDSATIDEMPKGQTLGITGAPNTVPGEDDLVGRTWTVCDVSRIDPAKAPSSPPGLTTYALLGTRVNAPDSVGRAAALVTPDGGKSVYLLANGKRSKIDPNDRAVGLALGTDADTVTPRPVSRGLLQAVPAGEEIAPPTIANVGKAVPWSSTITVGTVFAVRFATGTSFYVALDGGREKIGPVVADLIRADAGTTASIPLVRPSVLKNIAVVNRIDLRPYPPVQPDLQSIDQAPVVCLDWTGDSGTGSYLVYPTTKVGLPAGAKAVPAPPGGPATSADQVYVAPGKGAVIGQVFGRQKPTSGALFLVGDNGVKYPVVDTRALGYLGLGKHVSGAPPALLNLLPTGPALDPGSAAAYYPQRTGG